MYAKSFLALDGNGRLTGARTAQTAPYDRYTCHLCGSALRYHPQYDTEQSCLSQTDELSDLSVMTCSWPPHLFSLMRLN